MISARVGRPFYPLLNGAPSGMVGTLTLGLEWPDNTVSQAPSTANIVESESGSYTGTRTAPTAAGTYIIVWHDPDTDTSATEELVVLAFGVPDTSLVYTTPDEVRTHLGVTEEQMSDETLARPIRLAQDDIDAACGAWKVYEDTGLKFASADLTLTDFQALMLSRATCEQVEYRLTVGDDFLVREQYEAQSGPGYSTSGQVRKVSSRAYAKLSAGGFLRLTGRTSNRYVGSLGDLPSA